MMKATVQLVCLVFILIKRSLTNAELFNVALNKPTFQSGTLEDPDASHRWLSEHAVDGNKNCPSADSQYYSGTSVLITPWWQVDLGRMFTIEKVVVYGQPREEPYQLKGFRLYITRENSTNSLDLTYENTGVYGNGTFVININASHQQGRYLTIDLPKSGYSHRLESGPLVLCEVEIFTQVSDVAKIADITVSSTLVYEHYKYDKENVRDNMTSNQSIDTCGCCWVSANETNPQIQFILPGDEQLVTIKVIGRTDGSKNSVKYQLTGIEVIIDGKSVQTGDITTSLSTNTATIQPPPEPSSNITISRPKLSNSGDWYLIICEVFIYKEDLQICPPGQFGVSCREHCSSNCLGSICDSFSGRCASGCQPGYRNEFCNQTAALAKIETIEVSSTLNYGEYNYSRYNVIDNKVSNNTDACGCCWISANEKITTPFIKLILPSSENLMTMKIIGRSDNPKTNDDNNLNGIAVITDGRPVNKDNIHYNATDNTAIIAFFSQEARNVTISKPKFGSSIDWFLAICEIYIYIDACTHHYYGYNCSQVCGNCKNDETCHHINGTCLHGCAPGYKPENKMCNTACDRGTYGQDCVSCSTHCYNGFSQCDRFNGTCLAGCESGYMGHNCTTPCPQHYYGNNCSQVCGHCKNDETCHHINGSCLHGCSPGYKPEDKTCKTACDTGTYGQDCVHCSTHCYKGFSQCDRFNGTCLARCEPGYMGHNCTTVCDDGKYGANCNKYCHCKDDAACNKTTGQCPNGCDILWTGDNCSENTSFIYSIRKNVTTTQIGTFLTNNASNAIDGVDNYINESCGCCSVAHRQFETDLTYWEIDLGKMYLINAVSIFGRSDGSNKEQIKNAEVYAGNESLAANSSSGLLIFTLPSEINGKFHFGHEMGSPVIARFFIVRLNSSYLNLCEFLLGKTDCPNGSFGNGCLNRCHCKGNTKCDLVTGHCPTKFCEPGWQGDACGTTCDNRTFGDYCNTTCHCVNGTGCDPVNGICEIQQCEDGWKGSSCSSECILPFFGFDCNQTCHCLNNSQCNHINGTCEEGQCEPGWNGSSCSQECSARTFGAGCLSECHCLNGSNCHHINGTCERGSCEPGWTGPACDKKCSARTFGAGCLSVCHCHDGSPCHHINGTCKSGSCASGWEGSACSLKCISPSFGYACNHICHCINGTYCNHINGSCDINQCDDGWKGVACHEACSNKTFGVNCSSKCHCQEGSCYPKNGTCLKLGCEHGWQGDACVEPINEALGQGSGIAGVVGGASAAVIVIVIAVAVVGLFLYRRQKSKSSEQRGVKKFSHLDEALKQKQQRRADINSPRRVSGNVNSAYKETNVDDENNAKDDGFAGDGGGGYYDFTEVVGIRIHELWDYIQEKKSNECEKLFEEFKKLPSGLIHPCTSADQLVNRGKNRYREMYAYDHNRVFLEEKNDKGTDYVNASYIDGYNKTRHFVACQGPTKQMIEDFWKMVWQLKSDKIVMLTNLVEMGATKCIQYWPKDVEFSYGKVNIKIVKVDTDLDFDIRHLDVWKEGESPRRIRQYHFKSWPDKDVPDSTWCLLKFWRAVETDAESKAGPIIVHCSAGVGRTGTFIALDNLIHQARDEGCVRPFQIVQALRGQRVNMVQTKEQYVYLHEVLADALSYGTHFVWSTQFEAVYMSLLQREDGGTKKRLEVQYDLIQKSLKNTESKEAEAPEYSNMEMILSESDAYRPKLKKRGSKFVQHLGATLIPNYDGRNTFVVAMSPDKNTIEEFWSVVDDLNIKTVVMLTEKSSTFYKASCDLGAQNDNGGKFHVNKIEEKIRKGYTERSFTFKESREEEEDRLVTVKQFEYTAWKDGYIVPGDARSLVDLLDALLSWQSHISESQPVLIYDGDGCTRSGILCVALNEVQRIKTEGGHINIIQSVKTMKQRKPQLINTFEQYKFCYEIILAYLKHTEVYQNVK